MYKKIIIALLLVFSLAQANSGFTLLKIDVNPLTAATAGCEYLKKESSTALSYNPASLAVKNRTNFSAGYSKYLDDGQTGFIQAGKDTGYGSLGLEFSWLNMGKFEGREVPSEEPQYEFDAGYLNLTGGYAYSILENVQIGLAGKYLIEKNEFETANGYAVSAGIKLSDLLPGTVLSLAGNNFGKMNDLNKTATPLPSNIEAGASYNYNIADFSIFGAVKSTYLTQDEINQINCGLEVGYLNRFFVRSGYRIDNEGLPFTAGFGIEYQGFGVDYAFSAFKNDLGQIHSFALSYSL